MAKTTANPYDRREEDSRRRRQVFGEVMGHSVDILDDGRRAYPGFGLDRLQEVMRDEFARGFNCGEGTMERKTEEEILPRVQRQVWDEGHAAGHGDGAKDLLATIAEKYEALTVELAADIKPVLADEAAAPEQLRPLLSRACRLLEDLIRSHHDGFEPEPPF